MIKNKDFYILLLGRLITNFGDSLYSIASTLLVYEMSGSTLYSGITLFLTSSTAIVQLVLSPILDMINMKKFLVRSQFLQAILILIIPLLYYYSQLRVYHVMLIMPIISLINQLVYPGQISILPKILSNEKLVTGNSLFTIAYQGSNAIFDTLAGIIISVFGFMQALCIDSITFLITGILFIFLSKDIAEYRKDYKGLCKTSMIKNHFKQLKEGIAIFREPSLFALVLGIVFINFSATSISAVLPAFTNDKIFYSLMLASMGLGVLIGSLFSSFDFFKNFPLGYLYVLGMLIVGTSWFGVAYFQQSKWLTIGLYALGWFVVGIVNVYAQTMVQMIVPKNKTGSAMGIMVGISTIMAPFGALFGGWLGEIIGTYRTILIAGLIIIMVSVYWVCQESIRKLPAINNIKEVLLWKKI